MPPKMAATAPRLAALCILFLTSLCDACQAQTFGPDGRQAVPPQTRGARPGSGPAAQPELVAQNGHRGPAAAVAISPDKSLLASGGEDQSVKLWDARSGKLLRTFARHAGPVLLVAFTPDGRTLLSAGGTDNRLNAWNVTSGELLWKHDCGIAALHPDGKSVACAPVNFSRSDVWDSSITILNTRDGKAVRTIPDDQENYQISSLAYSPDGRLLAASAWPDFEAERPYLINIWNALNGGKPLKQINLTAASGGPRERTGNPQPTSELTTSMAFSPDGKVLALSNDHTSVSDDGTQEGPYSVTYWDPFTGRMLRRSGSLEGVLAFHPADNSLATGGVQVNLSDAKGSAFRRIVDGVRCLGPKDAGQGVKRDGEIGCDDDPVIYSADGQLLAAGGGNLRLWEPATGRTIYFQGGALPISYVSFGGGGKVFVTSNERATTAWDTAGGWPARSLGYEGALDYSPDGGRVAVPGEGGKTVDVFDTARGVLVRSLPVEFTEGLEVSFAGADKLFIKARNRDGATISQVVNVQSGKLLGLLTKSSEYIDEGRPVVSEDGKTVWDGSAVGDTTSGKWGRKFDSHIFALSLTAVSPDGRKVASAGSLSGAAGAYGNLENSGAVEVFDATTEAEIEPKDTNQAIREYGIPEPSALAFNRDGTLLAAGFIYGTVMVWDTRTGRLVLDFAAHSGTVGSIAFHPDGHSFASSGGDATVNLWSAQGRLLASINEFDEGEWAVATPDGLFDGSPRGWAQLIWRFSPRTLELAPVEIFFGDFYSPGLLADVFAGRQPPAPADFAQKDRRQPTLSLVRADGAAGGAHVGRSVVLRVNVSDAPAGAQDVRLFRNGSLVKVWRGDVLSGQSGCEPAGAGRGRCEATVTLTAGRNHFTAYAFNRDNIKSEDAVLDLTGAASLARAGTLYVMTIGVNEYANRKFDLRYATPDAQDFGAELKRQQEALNSFGRTEVIPLYDAVATKENVLRSIRELSDKVEPEDAVVIFFAGHGMAHGKRFYMIPHDLGYRGGREDINAAGLEQIRAASISDAEMESALERVSPGRMLLVIDACYSGQAVESEERRRGPMNSKGLAQLAYEKGMYILAAAQSFQAARGSKTYQHGYLTYALVEEGIRGVKADSEPQDGQVTMREWLDYAVARVPDMQREGEEKRVLTHDPAHGPARPAADDGLQRPRAFYRREREAQSMVVAKR